jgi:hypothetical protein
MKNFPKVNLV